ncbi:MAG: DUF6531 domain-containing protein, partial [Candidatus Omnitrophota bacterium]
LDAGNFTSTINPLANQTKQEAVNSRPSEERFSWGFQAQDTQGQVQNYEAVSQSLSRSKKDGGVKQAQVDMGFTVEGQVPLVMTRYYNSFYDKNSGFGLGWQISKLF